MLNWKKFIADLSTKPGVYRMYNSASQLLYVGKAQQLKKRVSNYFRKNLDNVKVASLMAQVEEIQVTIAANENEALLLEANIIKEHRPRYNVLMRDDKSYPYLFLSTEEKFPRLDYHRGTKRKKGRYFGPFPNSGSIREDLALIQKFFQLRQCRDSFFKNRSRPCLQYQIQRCTAPCVGYVTAEEYKKQVAQAILFLEGKSSEAIDQITQEMDQSALALDYERATILRDRVRQLRKLQVRQSITGGDGNIDVLAISQEQGKAAVAVLFIRGGRVIGHKVFFPQVPQDTSAADILMGFIPQYYLSSLRGGQKIDQVILSTKLPEKGWLQNALEEALQRPFKFIDTPKPVHNQWLLMARTNAQYGLAQSLTQKNEALLKLCALQQALKLPNPIQRVECFDVSHTQGEATVASCVVYTPEGAAYKEYRRFNIRDVVPGDDYAAIKQALRRRYTRLKEEGTVLPDVVMIDGGKGHLKQAETVFEELQITGVDLIAIAKGPSRKPGLEKIFRIGQVGSLQLAVDDSTLHLVQFIRDESHRFAITTHRKQRSRARLQSPLEFIEGIGAKRRRDLLRHFGGLQALRKASIEEIAKVQGISLRLAERVYDALR